MAMPLAGCPTATDCDGVAEMRVTYEKQAAYTARARGAQAHTRVITMYEKEREKEDRAVSKGESAGAEKEIKKEREAKEKENGSRLTLIFRRDSLKRQGCTHAECQCTGCATNFFGKFVSAAVHRLLSVVVANWHRQTCNWYYHSSQESREQGTAEDDLV